MNAAEDAATWDGLVVVMGASWWDGIPLLERHLAAELTRYAPVLYVNPTTSVLSRFRNREAASEGRGTGLRIVAPRLAVLDARVPPLQTRPVGRELAQAVLRRRLRWAVRRLGAPSVHAVVVPTLDDVFNTLGEHVRVFYAKDDYAAGAALTGVDERWISTTVRRRAREADVVVGVSPVLLEILREAGAGDPQLIPNGCLPSAFATVGPPDPAAPCAAFVGQLSDRVDVGLLEDVVDAGVRLVLVGPLQDTVTPGAFARLLAHPDVVWTGRVGHAELTAHLERVTTCLLPYADTAFNRASFPLKLIEYLAAGRRVVSTELPAVRWLGTPLVEVAPRDQFAACVAESLRSPLEQAEIDLRRAFAAGHGWDSRARSLATAIGLDPAGQLT